MENASFKSSYGEILTPPQSSKLGEILTPLLKALRENINSSFKSS